MRKILLLPLLFLFAANGLIAQTLTLPMQTGSFNGQQTTNTNGSYFAGAYDNTTTELGTYANTNGGGDPYIGDPGVAIFHALTTSGDGNTGAARALQVGDEFVINCYVGNNSSFFNNSDAGISFNGGTTYSAFSNYETLQRAKFQINKGGEWFGEASTAGTTGTTAVGGFGATFRLKVTSAKTVNIKVGDNSYNYDMTMTNSPGTSNNIQSFAIWNQTSGNSNNMFWRDASITSTGTVEIGGGNGSSTFDGAITNGLIPTSTSTVKVNSLTKSGTGTITLSAANTYTGTTSVLGGTLRLSGSGTYGIGSNVNISNGAVLDLNGVNATVASVKETGTGNGGTISLGAGTLTLSGGWTDINFQNSISGTGGLVKQGTGILSLYGTQSYTGNTTVSGGELATAVAMASSSYTINGGTLRLSATNILPDVTTVALSSGVFSVNFDETIANLNISGGTLSVAAGKVLTINGTLTISDQAQVSLGAGASIRYGSSGTIQYNLGALSVTPSTEWPATFGPASVTLNSGTVTLNGNKNIAGNLTINGGTLDLGTYTANRTTSGGTLTIADSATLKIGGTNGLPSNYDTHSIGSNSTIEFNGGAQTIDGLNSGEHYGNLTLSGSGVKTMTGNTVVDNDMALGSGVDFTITSGKNLTVGNQLNNSGNFIIEANANLIQVNDVVNTGNIKAYKNSAPMFRLDYALWSSPVAGETLAGFSPETLSNRFYHYNPASDGYTAVTGSTAFAEGSSYLIRVSNTHPAYVDGTSTPTAWTGFFTGVPNNGNVNVSVTPMAGTVQGYNAVGNPYPSPINVVDFFTANEDNIVTGSSLYFWRKKNDAGTSSYAHLNLSGYVANTGNSFGDSSNGEFTGSNSNWVLNPAQGFIVQAQTGTISFNNDMRRAVNNNQQFRTAQDETNTASRLWLNINGPQGEFGQTLIAYTENATHGLDFGWDGRAFTDGPAAIYSFAGESILGIQARPSFEATDEVPMGHKATTAGVYTIALDHVDGVFTQEQDIFLRDNLLGVTHDLRQSAYSFVTEAGAFEGRFDVIYARTLGTESPILDAKSIIVYKQNGDISINSGVTEMTAVSVYDTRGRLLYSAKGINATETSITGLQAEKQVLIINISTLKGDVSKKIIF